MKILFVCTSNIMRSPYCEFVFNEMIKESDALAKKVEWAKSGALRWRYHGMHKQAKAALVAEGFSQSEVDSYRPRHFLFDKQMFDEADVIIGMTESHKKMLPKKWRHKFCTLTEAALGFHKEIADPYWERLSQDLYNLRMAEIKELLRLYAEKLTN